MVSFSRSLAGDLANDSPAKTISSSRGLAPARQFSEGGIADESRFSVGKIERRRAFPTLDRRKLSLEGNLDTVSDGTKFEP
jgi:hypothetical protein